MLGESNQCLTGQPPPLPFPRKREKGDRTAPLALEWERG